MGFMLVGIACFELIPEQLLRIFSQDPQVLEIGTHAFHIIGLSFLPAVLSLMYPVFFQAIGAALPSVLLSLTRQIFCLIPIFWLLSQIGLDYTWFAFPIAELVTGSVGLALYFRRIRMWDRDRAAEQERRKGAVTMKLITAIVSKKDAGEVCAALTEAGLLLHQDGLHGRVFDRREHHPSHRNGGGPGPAGHSGDPGPLLPPGGEDLLPGPAGHPVPGLSH